MAVVVCCFRRVSCHQNIVLPFYFVSSFSHPFVGSVPNAFVRVTWLRESSRFAATLAQQPRATEFVQDPAQQQAEKNAWNLRRYLKHSYM